MVTVLKHRLALAVLVGVLVIPIVSVNNGGLSHLLFCEAAVAQPFAIGQTSEGSQVTSSTQVSRDEASAPFEGGTQVTEVCEGVRAEVSASPLDSERVQMTVTIVNDSQVPWRGSVGLAAAGQDSTADLTAALGEVAAGDSEATTLELRVPEGQTEIAGTLLLGP